jgi:Flp pilus assembly pilin Flp
MFLLKRSEKKQLGQSTTEYALTIGIIALFAVGAIYVFGTWNSNQMNSAASSVSGGMSGGQNGGGASGGSAGDAGQGTANQQTGGGGGSNNETGGNGNSGGNSSGSSKAGNGSGGSAGSVSDTPTPVNNKKQN